MDVEIIERTRIRQASASLRAGRICVQVPRHWPKTTKHEAVLELVEKVMASEKRRAKILQHPAALGPRITLATPKALEAYVRQLNAETLNLPLSKVRLGSSKYSQLAQMNTKTRTMTISRFCTHNVPQAALRYLVIHELAHLLEANHSSRFWALVAQFVPDYKLQARIMKAFHQQAVQQADTAAPETITDATEADEEWSDIPNYEPDFEVDVEAETAREEPPPFITTEKPLERQHTLLGKLLAPVQAANQQLGSLQLKLFGQSNP